MDLGWLSGSERRARAIAAFLSFPTPLVLVSKLPWCRAGKRVEVASELTTYLREDMADMGKDKPGALDLWWEMRAECPALHIVALHYLCYDASSSGVERLFSKTGLIKTKLRNRLRAEKLILTKANWIDSLYHVRFKKSVGVDECKGWEEDEEEGKDGDEEEDDEDVEGQWADMEEEVAGEDSEIVERNELGLDAIRFYGA